MSRLVARRWWLVAGAVALLVLGAVAGWRTVPHRRPFAPFVIPAHAEDQVQRFLQPLRLGAPVADGYVLDDISIDGAVIRLGLVNTPRGQRASVDVQYGSEGVALRPAANTPDAVVRAISGAILNRSNPPPSPWVPAVVGTGPTHGRGTEATPPPPGAKAPESAPAAPALRSTTTADWVDLIWWKERAPAGAVGATFIGLVIAALIVLRQRLAGAQARRRALMLAALGIGSLLLRLWLSPRTFLHEYYHIADNWRYIFEPGGEEQYGLAGPVLFRAANRIFGGQEKCVFLVNTVLAALTPAAAVLFVNALFASWSQALLAGVLVALLPEHLRFSGSEELWIGGALLAYSSLAAWALWLRSGGRALLAFSILALALAMQTRPELLPLPLAHAGLFFVTRPRSEWRALLRNRAIILAVVALALLVSFRIASVFAHRAVLPQTRLPSLRTLTAENTLFDARAMSPVLEVLALCGAAWGLLRARAATVWLLLLTGAYVLIPLTAFGNRPCIYRTQMFAMTLVAVVAAGAPRLVPRWRSWATGVVVLCAVQGLWLRRVFVTELLDQQQEFAFLDSSVPQLPERSELIGYFGPWQTIAPMRNPDWLDELPMFVFARDNKAVAPISLTDLGAAIPWPSPHPGLLYYQGMYCYVTGDPRQPVEPMRPPCASVRDHYTLEPLSVRTLDTRGYSSAKYAPGPYDIGFFRVTGLRPHETPDAASPLEQRERSAHDPL